jgi:membrane associated rhomboid family serine protease
MQLFSGVGSIGANASSGVAFWAHVAGFVAGVALGLLRRYRDKQQPQYW